MVGEMAVEGMRQLAPDWRPQVPVATDMLEWQIVNGSRSPGPGEYVIPTTMIQSGGRWGRSITKSNLELQIDAKRDQPGPAAYKLPDYQTNMKGGRMGTGVRPKSDVDWAIYRAKQTPGPGEYVIPTGLNQTGGRFGKTITKSPMEMLIDSRKNEPAPHDYDVNSSYTYLHSEQKKGGVMAGRGPKSDVDWAVLAASQKPGPGQYVIPTTISQSGGRFGNAITKSDFERYINRVKNDPAPHDYNVNASYTYLHSEQKKGGVMAGRSGCGPAKMPAPYEQFGNDSAAEHYRGAPSGSHEDACAPWRNEEAWSRVRKQPSAKSVHSVSNPDISAPSEPNVSGASAQSQPNELIKDYDEQGRAAPTLEPPRRVVDRAALTPEKRAEVVTPWRDTEVWSKIAKRPDPAAAERKAAMLRESTSAEKKPGPAPAPVRTISRKGLGAGEGHSGAVAPWRDGDAWRSMVRDPSVPEPPLPVQEKPDNTAIEAPWRVESWTKVGPKRKKKPAAVSLAPVTDAPATTATESSSAPRPSETEPDRTMPAATTSEPAASASSENESRTGVSEQAAEEQLARRREEKIAQIKRLKEELAEVKGSIPVSSSGEHQLQLQQQLLSRRRRPASATGSSLLAQKPGRVPRRAGAESVGRRRSSPNLPYGSDGGVRLKLASIYAKHNPEKVQDVDHLLFKYRGREAELLEAVERKYELSV